MSRRVSRRGVDARADVARHRHLRECDEQAAVGDVMHRRQQAVVNHGTDEIAVFLFLDQIDRRRRAIFLAADVAQVE